MTVNFDPDQLTTWGQRIFNGANGIKATAKEATIYRRHAQPRRPRPRPPPPTAAATPHADAADPRTAAAPRPTP